MSRPRRLATFDYRGPFAYSLTFCTFNRRRHFDVDATVRVVRDRILRTAQERDFTVLAYCFMPDHLHLLVQGRHGDAALRPFVKLARQRAATARMDPPRARLWQDGYHERTLRRDEHLMTVASYIVNNPVRARLVKTWSEWPNTGGILADAMRDAEAGVRVRRPEL